MSLNRPVGAQRPDRPAKRPSTLVATPHREPDGPPGARAARVLLLLAAFCSTWTAVGVGPGGAGEGGLKPVDLLLALAAVVGSVAIASRWRPLPAWLWLPAVGVVVVLLVHVVFPTPALYTDSRTGLDAIGNLLPRAPDALPNALIAVRWLVALAVVPLLVVNLYAKLGVPVDLLVWAWAAGAAVSALVATTDFAGLTHVGQSLLGFAQLEGRQTGLTIQPNHLGFSCALAVPAALHLFTRHRLVGAVLGLLLAAGILVSGSRGAQLVLVLVGIVCCLLFVRARRHLPVVAYAGGFVLLAAVAFSSHLAAQVGHVLRFGENGAAADSDSIRLELARQAIDDVSQRPVFGVGYQVLLEAHSIYLQVVAAGGLVLLGSLLVLLIGCLSTALRLSREGEVLAPYLFASVLTWTICGVIENQITDRYLYIPVAAVAALAAARAERARHG